MPISLPLPPYYVVIFASDLRDDSIGYEQMAKRMLEVAEEQPGFLGAQSVRDGKAGITVSYWASMDDIKAFKSHPKHQQAQALGKSDWYQSYQVTIAKVEQNTR